MVRFVGWISGLAVISGISGCAGDCEQLEGNYELTAVETSGTCGGLAPSVVTYRDGRQVMSDPDCRDIDRRVSEDMCTSEATTECPYRDTDGSVIGTLRVTGTVHRDADGDGADGTAQVCLTDTAGMQVCCSVYELAVRRL